MTNKFSQTLRQIPRARNYDTSTLTRQNKNTHTSEEDTERCATAYLRDHGADPDPNEDGVALQALDDVALIVYFASVDLVKQSHHDERVEDDGEMLVGRTVQLLSCRDTVVDPEQRRTCKGKQTTRTTSPLHCISIMSASKQQTDGHGQINTRYS